MKINLFKFSQISSTKLRMMTYIKRIRPLTINVPHHIETSKLICSANQLTGFYMMGYNGR